MKTLLFCISLITINSGGTNVYICNSDDAKVYHYHKDCRAIKHCGHEVKTMSIEEAKSKGRRLCGYEGN